MKERILSSRTAIVVIVAVFLIVGFILFDTVSNWGRAYGNVSIQGVNVGGMNAEEMHTALYDNIGSKLAGAQVVVYASEEARQRQGDALAQAQSEATAEEVSVEDAQANKTSWTADGTTLKATLPYDEAIANALEVGRHGGPFARIALAISGEDVPIQVQFDGGALDTFAAEIDKTVGDTRTDATVEITDGQAKPVAGHDGKMVDRAWLSGRLSDVMLGKDDNDYVIAEAADAPSRTTYDQAKETSDAVNRALNTGASFTYKTAEWAADNYELGAWTKVDVVGSDDGSFKLVPSVDVDTATSSLVKHVSATASSLNTDSIIVDFEVNDGNVVVKTTGSGEIPEVVPAIEKANDALYGANGVAWSAGAASGPVSIEIGESNAPETLGFEQAVDLGIITVIGEYTTEFSNEEGTENRNHNIKLVSELLNNTVCESKGGQWGFNEHTGDTNIDPPFASAGSIVNGEYVDSIGGGICQVATTVFNAVFEAGLDVVERRNHSLYIASYPTGRDVGVSYPELNFVWANNLNSDVLVRLDYQDTSVTAQLYSVYTGYQVTSEEGPWEEGSKYSTTIETDETLAKGDYYLKTTGENGSKVSVTRTVTDQAGNVISETLFESVYEPKNEVYVVGPGTDTSALINSNANSSTASYDSTAEDAATYNAMDDMATDGSLYEDASDGYADNTVYYDEGIAA